ncbi:family 2A encapsulin nanocompartment shell protein [Treponema sp. R80B11-R83G3]
MATTELNALNKAQAYQLADITKTPPQFGAITPRWLTRFLEFKGLDAGIYRVNKVVEGETPLDVLCSSEKKSAEIPEGYVQYQPKPREYTLSSISTIINVDTAVEDVFSSPYDQTKEQLHLAIESLRERQESQIINNDDYGLLKNVPASQHIKPGNKAGSPMPDDLDELISKVWKEPTFFLAHPRAVAAFQRECTRRGVPPSTTSLFGGSFILWRGIPIIPTDKLFVDGLKNPKSKSGKTNILLVRTGEAKRGVVGLYQTGLQNEQGRGLSVRFRGVDNKGLASYLLSLYCSAAILADDAIAVLEDVEVGNYYDYT